METNPQLCSERSDGAIREATDAERLLSLLLSAISSSDDGCFDHPEHGRVYVACRHDDGVWLSRVVGIRW